MSILNLVMLALPVVFLVASVVVAVKAYEKGHNRKKTVLMQIAYSQQYLQFAFFAQS